MTKNPKLLIALAAVVAAVAAYWMLVLSPKREELAKLDADVTSAQTELATAQATLKTYEKAQGAYRKNYATVVRLGKAVPADDDVRSLMVQLNSAADRSNISFDRITVGGSGGDATTATTAGAAVPPPGTVSVGPAGFAAMPFKLAFEGSFANLSGFFSRLEHFVTLSETDVAVTGRLLRVESLSLKPSEDGTSLNAEIGASSYLLPATESVTAGGSPTAPAPASTGAPGGSTPPTTPPTTAATSTGALR